MPNNTIRCLLETYAQTLIAISPIAQQALFATETASFTAVGFCGKIKQVLEEHKLNANKKLSK